jgi:hypothetical protein
MEVLNCFKCINLEFLYDSWKIRVDGFTKKDSNIYNINDDERQSSEKF